MELTLPPVDPIAPDCLSILATALVCRIGRRVQLPLELRLLGALLAELAGWAADEWADRRASRRKRSPRC